MKVCPCCGVKPQTRWYWETVDWGDDGNTPTDEKRWVAECDNDDCPCYISTKGYETEEKAIEVWDNMAVFKDLNRIEEQLKVVNAMLDGLSEDMKGGKGITS